MLAKRFVNPLIERSNRRRYRCRLLLTVYVRAMAHFMTFPSVIWFCQQNGRNAGCSFSRSSLHPFISREKRHAQSD